MAEKYDMIPDLAEVFAAAHGYRADAHVPAHRIAEHLGLSEDDSAEKVAGALRKALGLKACQCSIDGGPGLVIPIACPVHGIPCEDCGGLEGCKENCGEDGVSVPVGSGFDADGTPWSIAASGSGVVASVGNEDVLLKGVERDRFAEAVARAVTPGQVSRPSRRHDAQDSCRIHLAATVDALAQGDAGLMLTISYVTKAAG